ncbi:unnamed protein product [Phytophthora fragariaefolia]|uniref:Unnamed protein product n=1 Tax=Phytophthora fragariaefolia TaxID=1490495 RepID=A0A9W6XNY6_9STRA|nr:unnamed protein product [Phytophthora fragariaefolia]
MNTCILQPPNNKRLSDDVIGGVALRKHQTERYLIAEAHADGHRQSHGLRGCQQEPTHSDNATAQRPHTEDIKRKWSEFSGANPITDDSLRKLTLLKRHEEVIRDVLTEQDRLRELRRLRQIRYRKKKEEYTNTLDEENKNLRGKISELERRRRSMSSAIPPKQNVWNVAADYFRLFRYGFQSASPSVAKTQTSAQLDFLKRAMTYDVVFNAGRGPEAVARSWKCLSIWFQDVELELEGMVKDVRGSLTATTSTSVTISEGTIRNVFPHLSGESVLVKKLLNQRVVVRGSIRFEWDDAVGRVCGVVALSNLLTPILRLVESLDDVSKVFEQALITPDFQWRSMA